MKQQKTSYIGIGLFIGITLGAVYGILTDQFIVGVAIGVGFGLTIGASMQTKRTKTMSSGF